MKGGREVSHVLIRDVDEEVLAAIRERARRRGVSMQKELRSILNRVRTWEEAEACTTVYPPVRPARVIGKPASRMLIEDRRSCIWHLASNYGTWTGARKRMW
jgi:plasmid stability protein